MAGAHSNTRLNVFCDGVFAIALTLVRSRAAAKGLGN
jgi:hypothetical protein